MSFVYKIHKVPTDDATLAGFMAGKLASLRLQAMVVSPGAFGGQEVLEKIFKQPHTLWVERIQRPNLHTFVAIAYPEATTEEERTVDTGDVVGVATLIGPIPKLGYDFASNPDSVSGADDQESKWHATGLYSSPGVRGKGIGAQLVAARIAFAKQHSATEAVRIRALVHPDNTKVLDPLRARGFVATGKCTAAEAVRANGDAFLLPPDGGASRPETFFVPMGLVMEFVTTR